MCENNRSHGSQESHIHTHAHANGHAHAHSHSHSHSHAHSGSNGNGYAYAHAHDGHTHTNIHTASPSGVELNIGLMEENEDVAARNRRRMEAAGVRCINLMSSPGSGKTTLLERTLAEFDGSPRIAVMEGDMTTELDADRLRAYGAPTVAITTGRSCHLEAGQISDGLDKLEAVLPLSRFDLMVIENVGNLICPAAYELGEHARVVLVAVTEGEDKPLKYPIMFHGADVVVLTKLDLAPYLKLDIDRLAANVQEVNPTATVFAVSAESGEGMAAWLEWMRSQVT